MKKVKWLVPIMVISAFFSVLILRDHPDVTFQNKVLITMGASLVSAVIGFILLKQDIDKVDPKPPKE
ncbi:hypothetical protein ACF3OH_13180 [Chryseomicrobium aureum]|uniref:hypothetical protein n=1 Tax=Chryseomicrobium aureum TaxID=1441723 RepID=UPI0019566CBE|nr:hypothetical protein [Chryseomicrobium aureum]MBM7706256.1 Na+/H+ antiporter NhaA [Chryseomicrobium aureum]